MEFFVYYFTETMVVSSKPIEDGLSEGMEVWLDGCDGFDDQFFESVYGKVERLRFVPIAGWWAVPTDPDSFGRLPVVTVRILENKGLCARALVENIDGLLPWATGSPLGPDDAVSGLPDYDQPDEGLLDSLKRQLAAQATVFWTERYSRRRADRMAALFLFKTVHGEERVILFRDHANRSHVCSLR